MSFAFNDLASARDAIRKVAAQARTSITAASDGANLSRGSVTRFVSARGQRQNPNPDIYLGTIIQLLDYLGYELVIRKKVGTNGRARLLAAVREEQEGEQQRAS